MAEQSEVAVSALREEIAQAIRDIRDRKGTDTCGAHDAVARGLIVLLRCQLASLDSQRRQFAVAAVTATAVSAVITPLALLVAKFF